MKKRIEVPDSFNFCDPADWCEFFDVPLQQENEGDFQDKKTEEYAQISVSERLKILNEMMDKTKSKDIAEDLGSEEKTLK